MRLFNYRDKEILRLALPSIVQNVTVPLLGLADVAIMGHIGDARYIGAIAVGSMIFNVMYWLCGFLRMGTSGLTAQAFGEKRGERKEESGKRREESGERIENGGEVTILRASLRLALAIGLGMVVLQVPLRALTFWLMQPTADVAALCLPYFNICIWGAPAVLGLYALTGWFIGMQDTRTPMMVAIAQNIINIAVSATLVFWFGLGVTGVATGTVMAQWLGFLLAGTIAYQSHKPQPSTEPRPSNGSFSWHRFFAINRDIFLRTLCLVAVNLYFTSAGAAQGALTLAVNTLLMQLFTLFSYFMDGFAYAGEALAGRYYGERNQAALRDVVERLFRWGWAMVAVFTLVYWGGGTPFLHLLTNDTEVVSAAAGYLPWALLIPLSGMAAFVWDGIFIGITYTRGMLVSCLMATVLFFVLWLAGSPTLGNHALWLALVAYLSLRGIAQWWLWCRLS